MQYREVFENGKFKTTNTPLAAYLKSEGYVLQEIDTTEPKRAVMIFLEDAEIRDKVRAYHTCQAIGNIPVYQDIYHELVARIKILAQTT